ncbi:hypothetical protein ACWCV9_37415 [Streptomyces sp. NPDC001606]
MPRLAPPRWVGVPPGDLEALTPEERAWLCPARQGVCGRICATEPFTCRILAWAGTGQQGDPLVDAG